MNAARAWPIAIVGMLALTVGANAMLMWKATDENGAAVEPDYYRKAVAWDSTLARRERSRLLGWASKARLHHTTGATEIHVSLRDAANRPLAGARVTVSALHNLAGGRVTTAMLEERAPGAYTARIPVGRSGVWELRLVAERAGDQHVATHRVELAP